MAGEWLGARWRVAAAMLYARRPCREAGAAGAERRKRRRLEQPPARDGGERREARGEQTGLVFGGDVCGWVLEGSLERSPCARGSESGIEQGMGRKGLRHEWGRGEGDPGWGSKSKARRDWSPVDTQ